MGREVSTRWECSKPHPAWSWTPPGIQTPQTLWTCFSASPLPQLKISSSVAMLEIQIILLTASHTCESKSVKITFSYAPQPGLVKVTYLQLLVWISSDRFRWMTNGPAWPLGWIPAYKAYGNQESHENFKTDKPWNINLAFLFILLDYTWPPCPCPRTNKDAFPFHTLLCLILNCNCITFFE